jgi:hypothetical protein
LKERRAWIENDVQNYVAILGGALIHEREEINPDILCANDEHFNGAETQPGISLWIVGMRR